jgi:hypothetical protein
MEVELHQDNRKLVATFTLKDGVAMREGGPDWLDGVRIFEPGDPPVEVHPADGERYLRGLLVEFSGTRLRASLRR